MPFYNNLDQALKEALTKIRVRIARNPGRGYTEVDAGKNEVREARPQGKETR